MVAAISFSALMALSLTPALCATLLKPVKKGDGHVGGGLFGWFNRGMQRARTAIAAACVGSCCAPAAPCWSISAC